MIDYQSEQAGHWPHLRAGSKQVHGHERRQETSAFEGVGKSLKVEQVTDLSS